MLTSDAATRASLGHLTHVADALYSQSHRRWKGADDMPTNSTSQTTASAIRRHSDLKGRRVIGILRHKAMRSRKRKVAQVRYIRHIDWETTRATCLRQHLTPQAARVHIVWHRGERVCHAHRKQTLVFAVYVIQDAAPGVFACVPLTWRRKQRRVRHGVKLVGGRLCERCVPYMLCVHARFPCSTHSRVHELALPDDQQGALFGAVRQQQRSCRGHEEAGGGKAGRGLSRRFFGAARFLAPYRCDGV